MYISLGPTPKHHVTIEVESEYLSKGLAIILSLRCGREMSPTHYIAFLALAMPSIPFLKKIKPICMFLLILHV